MLRDVYVGPTTIVQGRDSFMLVVHDGPDVGDEEFDQCSRREADFARSAGGARILVVPAPVGTTLTAKQRGLIRERLPSQGVRTALLTTSAATRAVLVALGWFMPDIKGFAPDAYEAALQYLGVSLTPTEIQAAVTSARTRLASARAGDDTSRARVRR